MPDPGFESAEFAPAAARQFAIIAQLNPTAADQLALRILQIAADPYTASSRAVDPATPFMRACRADAYVLVYAVRDRAPRIYVQTIAAPPTS